MAVIFADWDEGVWNDNRGGGLVADIFVKDPNAVLDYAWDWSRWLADAETIASASVTADGTVVVDSTDTSGGVVTAWVSGGTSPGGKRFRLTVSDGGALGTEAA